MSSLFRSNLFLIKRRIEKANAAVSSKTLEKGCNNIYSKINQIINENDGHIDQHNIWMKLLEYLYYDTY